MSAQVIDIRTREVISDGSEIEPVEEITAEHLVEEVRDFLEAAVALIADDATARLVWQADARLGYLGDALAVAAQSPA
jgi:hypothetical protein